MSQDPFKYDHHLRTKLNEYYVEIPDIPLKLKVSRWERLVQFLASPTKDPFESIISTQNGFILLKIGPIVGTAAFALIQALLLL